MVYNSADIYIKGKYDLQLYLQKGKLYKLYEDVVVVVAVFTIQKFIKFWDAQGICLSIFTMFI